MKNTILIVDDMEINRAILAEGFKDKYNILEISNGKEAIKAINNNSNNISAILLDLIMPEMDGIAVLREMNRTGIINHIPVFIVTAAENEEMLMDAYDLGAVDVITKPFMMNFLRCRIGNIIELYSHRNDLENIVLDQVQKIKELNRSMIETLATVIEFRDCESGEHVKRICSLTGILMHAVISLYPKYSMPESEIQKIVTAAVLHDVGKIAIPDNILNKPARLTDEEFKIMKLHTVRGCELLENFPEIMDSDTYAYSYDICRHHHERWDGRGYPDALKGDEISIWSQVVSVADVYDALTSPRVYKKAFTHETAVEMINGGQCGTFNPEILEAFNASLDEINLQHISEIQHNDD